MPLIRFDWQCRWRTESTSLEERSQCPTIAGGEKEEGGRGRKKRRRKGEEGGRGGRQRKRERGGEGRMKGGWRVRGRGHEWREEPKRKGEWEETGKKACVTTHCS